MEEDLEQTCSNRRHYIRSGRTSLSRGQILPPHRGEHGTRNSYNEFAAGTLLILSIYRWLNAAARDGRGTNPSYGGMVIISVLRILGHCI